MFKNKTRNEIMDFFKDYNCKIVKFSKNDIIALESSPCEKVGLVLTGNVDIKRILTSNTVIHLSSFGPGRLFGEVIAFSDTNRYPATVISATNSEIMFIGKNDFIKFCTHHPDFLSMFLNELTNKIITLNKSIAGLSFSSIRQKLTNFLLTEYNIQNSLFIELNMTKQKLSEILGVPRPSLSRELINMKNLGLIDYSKDFIKILDKDALEEILME
ncbi:Crp/Fnr family transcriptional regulator [Clostridium sp. CCUG 7971]|uniref:Crp/Fnr family transcriptional regulator n=1 Tax=Clostridium sp. CCUG 7971 TaxID=2811414 RepID=UPI001ABBA17B|nr:Crp/Fnr family transcriptional regulator [Clostridium sp. CCUG 7971]MBO3443600.1 Crp/Fnr family transcriptional regulator [Clostridium sp. CCUG 7971]